MTLFRMAGCIKLHENKKYTLKNIAFCSIIFTICETKIVEEFLY